MRMPRVRPGAVERGPLTVLVFGASLLLIALSARGFWSVGVVVTIMLVLAVTIRVDGRTPYGRLCDVAAFRHGHAARRAELSRVPLISEVEVTAGICGVRQAGGTVIAMIQLVPNLDLPTVIADKTIYTEDTVPLAALLPLREQYGLVIDLDIVTTGSRTRSTGGYTMLYDQLIGANAVVGSRVTWLVARLDQRRNLAALSRRGPVAVVAPRALATAAHRIATRLREQGIGAQPLPAAAMSDALRLLHAGVELSDLRERWSCLQSSVPGRCVTSFLVDWSQLGADGLAACWSTNRGHTTLVVTVGEEAGGPRALVRYIGPPVAAARYGYLRSLPGRQSVALQASLAGEATVSGLASSHDSSADRPPAELTIPIGPNGQVLGSLEGRPRHALALPLFDPTGYNPRRRTVEVHAKLSVAQQIVLRATAVGADVEIYTARPNRWRHLVAAVGDPSSLRLVAEHATASDAPTASIAVFDHVAPRATAAQTTVTISDPGGPRAGGADLVIDQVSTSAVDISMSTRTVRVDLIEPRGETRYLDAISDPPEVAAAPVVAIPAGSAPDNGIRTWRNGVER
ncbi:type VII secretion protein EccE [Nocardia brasiliensis]|uniref:type VII secretion protein EccE n=1 Tax=Nocardia brasiliensis TaxID=37326 RepID=UPI002455F43B|nr:type VII secretion protein EccE [Nocardia brasiliensis]